MLAAVETSLPLSLYATLPFWPLIGAILSGVWIAARRTAHTAHWPVVLGVAISAILGVALFSELGRSTAGEPARAGSSTEQGAELTAMFPGGDLHAGAGGNTFVDHGTTFTLYNWMSFGDEPSRQRGQWIAFNFYFDRLTGVMMLYITVVSLLILIYSIGYMRDHHGRPERGYERFFAFLGLFVFSMCILAMAGNFVLLYLGWEAVGLCSYLLIGFYYPRPSAAAAAKKAFIVNRVGDFGFALGVFSIYWFLAAGPQPLVQPGENPLDYAVVFKYVGQLEEWQITLIALLLLCGAVGKSAQFPLYVWLPDAMEGPTPVSALIHAATMVTAGVYMIARCGPIYAASTTALGVVAVVGVIGAFLAATMAMAQYDMKRILAYSTISQLAYMFVGLGCGAPDSAVFHVFTHAWFKALLFLCAGSVMHAMGGVIDVRQFSGLRSVLPTTYRLMVVGCLALAGFPLLSGFWSKDEIIHAAFFGEIAEGMPWLGGLLLLTAGITAYYTFRMLFLCFHGPLRLPKEAGEHPHESPPVMLRPLYVLALGSIFAGYLGVSISAFDAGASFLGFLAPHGYFHEYLHASTLVSSGHHPGGIWLMYVSALVALAGIGLAWMRYGAAPVEDPDARTLGVLWRLWHAKYYVDELYDRVIVQPLRRLGQLCFATDNNGIDGLIWFAAAVPRGAGSTLRALQRGALQGYALAMVLGLVALLAFWQWLDAAAG